MKNVLEFTRKQLQSKGLDISHPFCVQDYNYTQIKKDWLPTYDRENTGGILIGNSKCLWDHFIHYLHENPDRIDSENPLDDYVSKIVTSITEKISSEFNMKIMLRYSTSTGCEFVDMLKLATVSGLAYYHKILHLGVHPEYGSWFSLRAVMILDVDFDNSLRKNPPILENPILHLEDVLQQHYTILEANGGIASWKDNWQEWVVLRRIAGSAFNPMYEYSSEQIEYHYIKNKSVLIKSVNNLVK